MIEAGIRIYRGALRPSGSPIRGKGELNVELAISVVLPGREQVSGFRVDGDSGVIVGSDPWARYTFFWPAAEVAQWFSGDDVIPNLAGLPAIHMGCAIARTSPRMTTHGKLLGIGIVLCRVAVIENDYKITVGEYRRI
jgi:hypothetical protein